MFIDAKNIISYFESSNIKLTSRLVIKPPSGMSIKLQVPNHKIPPQESQPVFPNLTMQKKVSNQYRPPTKNTDPCPVNRKSSAQAQP